MVTVTTQQELIIDTSQLEDLTLATALGTLIVPILLPLAAIFAYELFQANSAEENFQGGGISVGAILAEMLNRDFMLTEGKKFTFIHQRVDVTNKNVTAGGLFAYTDRTPTVRIVGPTSIKVDPSQPQILRTYRITATEMREDPEHPWIILWEADGNIHNQGELATPITFDTEGVNSGILRKRVAVTVTDSDGLTANAEINVSIVSLEQLLKDLGIPPICLTKPYLPQCKPF